MAEEIAGRLGAGWRCGQRSERQAELHRGALAWGRADGHAAGHQLRPLLHAHQPEVAVGRQLTCRLREFKKVCIIEAVAESNGNISAAARILGMDPANLRKMMIELGIER